MKKFVPFFALILGLVFVSSSCEKCKSCHVTVTDDYAGFEQTSSTHVDYCGDEYDDAPSNAVKVEASLEGTKTTETTCQ